MKIKLVSLLFVFVLLLVACAPSAPLADANAQTDAIVQGAFQTLTAAAPVVAPQVVKAATATIAPANAGASAGSIAGNLSYPAAGIPPLLVVAFNNATGQYYWAQTAQNQTTYQLDNLPPGSYHVFAYALPEGKQIGAYDQFVLCGAQASCTDMSLVDVNVQAGVVTPNINPGNWYGNASMYPSMPNDPGIPNLGVGVAGPGDTGASVPATTASITGQLSYPSEGIPALLVVALNRDTSQYYSVTTSPGQTSYQIDNVPPGPYTVVAYNGDIAGGYSQAVLCGLSADCTDHNLIVLQVSAGQFFNNINPQDWYASQEGAFPKNPTMR